MLSFPVLYIQALRSLSDCTPRRSLNNFCNLCLRASVSRVVMKNNAFIKWAAALAAAVTLGSTLVIAADGRGDDGVFSGIRQRIHDRLVQLGLSSGQRDQVREVLRGFMPEVAPLVKQSVAEHRTLRQMIRATPVNEEAIRTQAAKVAAIDAELAVKRAQIVEKIRPILTPEQLKEIQEMEENLHSRVEQGLGRLGRWIEG